MSKNTLFSFLSVAAITLGLSVPAVATTVSLSSGPTSPIAGSTETFDSGVLPSNYTASGPHAGVVSGSLFDVYLAPSGDTSPYAYVGSYGSLSASYSTPITSFGLYWGSVDSYNGISFTGTDGSVTTFGLNGTPIAGMSLDTNSDYYVTFTDTGAAWSSVSFTSLVNSFEFDNVTTSVASSSSPEPASLALLAGGLMAIGAGAIRRRRSK